MKIKRGQSNKIYVDSLLSISITVEALTGGVDGKDFPMKN